MSPYTCLFRQSINQVGPRFRRGSDMARRDACSRAAIQKRAFKNVNDGAQSGAHRNVPPRWLQRAQSAHNMPTTSVNSCEFF